MKEKGQARIHEEFYRHNTMRHDSLVARTISPDGLKLIHQEILPKCKITAATPELKTVRIAGTDHTIDWAGGYEEPKIGLEVPCKMGSGDFVIGWADVLLTYRATFTAWLDRQKGVRVGDTPYQTMEQSYGYGEKWVDHPQGNYLTKEARFCIDGRPTNRTELTLVLDAKPDIDSPTSIIRQVKTYRDCLRANYAAVVTHNHPPADLLHLFEVERIFILTMDEKREDVK